MCLGCILLALRVLHRNVCRSLTADNLNIWLFNCTFHYTFPLLCSKCGVQNPSWAEIKHFTEFLNIQLHSCELSVFCDESLVGDIMSGLKGFVVKFMMLMSRVS